MTLTQSEIQEASLNHIKSTGLCSKSSSSPHLVVVTLDYHAYWLSWNMEISETLVIVFKIQWERPLRNTPWPDNTWVSSSKMFCFRAQRPPEVLITECFRRGEGITDKHVLCLSAIQSFWERSSYNLIHRLKINLLKDTLFYCAPHSWRENFPLALHFWQTPCISDFPFVIARPPCHWEWGYFLPVSLFLMYVPIYPWALRQHDIRIYFLNLHKMKTSQMGSTCFP